MTMMPIYKPARLESSLSNSELPLLSFPGQPLWLCRTVSDYMIFCQIIWPWSRDHAENTAPFMQLTQRRRSRAPPRLTKQTLQQK